MKVDTLFGYDMKLIKKVTCDYDAACLQMSLDIVLVWFSNNNMEIKPKEMLNIEIP